ncbi:MAG: hypothetical protein ACE5I0_10720, partial [Candidatus Binatia bacterium]
NYKYVGRTVSWGRPQDVSPWASFSSGDVTEIGPVQAVVPGLLYLYYKDFRGISDFLKPFRSNGIKSK